MPYYNNGFLAPYQPMYQSPQYQVPQFQPTQQNYQAAQQGPAQSVSGVSIVQIQGEAAAKSYLVAPNNTVQLWDMDAGTIYIKSADASGMPSMKILDFSIRVDSSTPSASPTAEYATKGDVETLKGQIDSLRMRIGKLAKKEADDE